MKIDKNYKEECKILPLEEEKALRFMIPAAYLILMKGEDVLLLRRYNTGYEDGNYSLIAGHVEGNETFEECIIRETYEEVGIKPLNLRPTHVLHRIMTGNNRLDIFYKADSWEGEIENKEPYKCDELKWTNIHKLPKNVIPYIADVIKNMGEDLTMGVSRF